MSRTYKDKPSRIRFPRHSRKMRELRYEWVEYECVSRHAFDAAGNPKTYTQLVRLERKGVLPKVRREVDHEWHWLRCEPSWFTRMFMNRPQRRAGRVWERTVARCPFGELDDEIIPGVERRPHVYWW